MNDENSMNAAGRDRVLEALRELIEALDRRVVHMERLGEAGIASEAAALRKEAATRIEQLTTAATQRHTREAEFTDAVMADDGGPLRRN